MISLSLFIRRSDIHTVIQPYEEVITSFYFEQNSSVSCYGIVTNNVSSIVLVWTLMFCGKGNEYINSVNSYCIY